MPVILYKRQRQIVDYIAQYTQKNGFSPTLKEIADSIGVTSLATVHEHINALIKKRVVRRYDGAVRGIELIDKKLGGIIEAIEVPIMGFIAAGKPIEPITDPNATITISPTMITGKKRSFVLQVKGDSMIEDGIFDGDYVVIEEQNEAKNGDIVVALLENGLATLKRFYKEATRVRLEPANAAMRPIYATSVRIQGRCVGVIRRYTN